MLICAQGTIIEIFPDQELKLEVKVDHPNLILIEEPRKNDRKT